ncbi:helix-turn-helix domain-containing protein [Cystobacter fuscus]
MDASQHALVPGVVRIMVRLVGPAMLTVREVAGGLAVCRATVYALLERGELERVWVGRSIRIPGGVARPDATLRCGQWFRGFSPVGKRNHASVCSAPSE